MENFHIERTVNTPDVIFNKDTQLLSIVGRCYPENSDLVFSCLKGFSHAYIYEKLDMIINLEYFNTASAKQLFNLVKYFAQKEDFKFKLFWYYEEEDHDSYDTGLYFQHGTECDIEFIKIEENE
jgi:hypothetical protein